MEIVRTEISEEDLKNAEEYSEEIPEKLLELLVAGQCDAECKPPSIRGGKIWCVQTKECTNQNNCDCFLHRLKKKIPDEDEDYDKDPEWEQLPRRKKYPYEPKKYHYRCWCVVIPDEDEDEYEEKRNFK